MTVTIADIPFDRVSYDREADVLYLHVGDPSTAVDFDGTPEGHHLRFDSAGRLVGITIVGAQWQLDRNGRISITLPERIEVGADVLGQALATA